MADTIYIGGGTPSIIGDRALIGILESIYDSFSCCDPEVTIEVNPSSGSMLDFAALRRSGVNRVSIGMQSAVESELKLLQRRHTREDVKRLVYNVKDAGIDNVSIDLMCCIPNQSLETLGESIEFCCSLDVSHISSYMLSIEEGTAFYGIKDSLKLANEDEEKQMYLYMCRQLEKHGYAQYEISNFAKKGYESKNNLKYWNCDDYLGIGPSAHSLIDKKRFYFGESLDDFYSGKILFEPDGGSPEEYSMLRLRLTEGLRGDLYRERFGTEIPSEYISRALKLEKHGLVKVDGERIRLTPNGFLLSNAVTARILWD